MYTEPTRAVGVPPSGPESCIGMFDDVHTEQSCIIGNAASIKCLMPHF